MTDGASADLHWINHTHSLTTCHAFFVFCGDCFRFGRWVAVTAGSVSYVAVEFAVADASGSVHPRRSLTFPAPSTRGGRCRSRLCPPEVGFKPDDWHHVVLTWQNFDTDKRASRHLYRARHYRVDRRVRRLQSQVDRGRGPNAPPPTGSSNGAEEKAIVTDSHESVSFRRVVSGAAHTISAPRTNTRLVTRPILA